MVGHSGTIKDAMVAAARTPIFVAGPSRWSAEVPGTARNTRPPRRGRAGCDVAGCPGEAPGRTTVPSVTSIVRVHARPMSSRSCEMTTSVRPSMRRMCPRSSSSPRRLSRSRPARGSSRTSTRGRDARSPAIATRRIWPPLSSSTLRPARSAGRPTRCRLVASEGVALLRGQLRVESGGGEDVLGDGRPLQLQSRVLKRQRYRTDRLCGGHAVDRDGAAGRLDQPGEHPGERRLA